MKSVLKKSKNKINEKEIFTDQQQTTYEVITGKRISWTEARGKCRSRGGELWGTDEKLQTIAGRL